MVTGSSHSITLGWKLGEDQGYPFRLEFFVCCRISSDGAGGGRAELLYHAHNLGEESAPAGFGWHSYFRLPGIPASEHKITIPSQNYVEVESDLMPTGRFPAVSESGGLYDFRTGRAAGAESYDIAFPASDASCRSASIAAGEYRLTMAIDGAFSYFQLFTPPDGGSIALEPLTNVTDAFNRDDMGMRVLEPGARMSGKISLSLGRLS
jgi:aldose 1-epimerase